MKTKCLFVLLMLTGASLLFPIDNPWGNLKKIHFYDSLRKYDQVREQLNEINGENIAGEDMGRIANELIRIGDKYLEGKDYELADLFYRKVISFSPDYWRLYDRIHLIEHERNGFLPDFSLALLQLRTLLNGFKASFVLVNVLFNLVFFSGVLVFFLYLLLLFIKYFKLSSNDLLFAGNGSFSVKRLLIAGGLLLWPVFMLGGWMIYPFLLCGFLWTYINDNERKAVITLVSVIFLFSLFYCVNLKLERTASSDKFMLAQKVYEGKMFERDVYDKFDSRLKVAQALSYYQNNKSETAMEILASASENPQSDTLKFALMGNIYFKLENFIESIKYYNLALQLDEKDPVVLNNLTLALIKNNDDEVLNENIKRFPAIDEIRKTISNFQELKISPSGFLWSRLINDNEDTFELASFFRKVLTELIRFPVIYFIALLLIYVYGLKRVLPTLGESIYCSKCSKIIKEAVVHRSYKLCDECYQLFSIKDVIFLEAKILKEKELGKRFRKKYVLNLLASVIFPGANFNIKEYNNLMTLSAVLFYFLLGFAVFGGWVFEAVFASKPLILNFVGMLALILYFLINLVSVLGDSDGI